MKKILLKLGIATVLMICIMPMPGLAYNHSSFFVVKHIDIVGLQRISQSTARKYLPLTVGQKLTNQRSIDVIKALYHTGFFSDVRINRQGNSVLIYVKERPTIGSINFSGNTTITNKDLLKALKYTHINDGAIYDVADIKMIIQGLKQQYANLGYHNAIVDVKTEKLPRNRVGVFIRINEGGVAKVHRIRIMGNRVFNERKLLNQLTLTTSGLFTFFTHNDRYTQAKLAADLTRLTNFYLDRGYLRFAITGKKVSMSNDKKQVDITIQIKEGGPYKLSGFAIQNDSKVKTALLRRMITLKRNTIFSRAQVLAINNKLESYFADRGFAFPSVNLQPKIDDQHHLVFLTYQIKPGHLVYVRHINFHGNNYTSDDVLRRQMVQLEGALFSEYKIKESKRRLANLPYLQNIQVQPQPVLMHPHQIDLNYQVNEINASRASLIGGYSDVEGFIYGVGFSAPNFMGSGKLVSLDVTRSAYDDSYSFKYYNPYYTINNVGRGFSFYYTHAKPGSTVNMSSYEMDGFGGTLNYDMPISEYSSLSFGFGYDNIHVISNSLTAKQILNLLKSYGTHYNQFKLLFGWEYGHYDRAVFPTKGFGNTLKTELGLPVFSSSLGYYKLSYDASWYHALNHSASFVLNLHTHLGYGNGYGRAHELPFFNRFFAGGISTIPGFSPNTLGPKDRYHNGLGGNLELVAGTDIIFPNPISKSVRTSLTFNIGNIYNDAPNQVVADKSLDASGPLRYSLGIRMTWYSPFGPLQLTLAQVLNKRPNDQLSLFNFSFGTGN